MSHHLNINGFTEPSTEWLEMKAAYDACDKAGVRIPEEVQQYFHYEPPKHPGQPIDITKAVTPYRGDMEEGFDVDISKLPPNVKLVRFHVSY